LTLQRRGENPHVFAKGGRKMGNCRTEGGGEGGGKVNQNERPRRKLEHPLGKKAAIILWEEGPRTPHS